MIQNYIFKRCLVLEIWKPHMGPDHISMMDVPKLVFGFGQKFLYHKFYVGRCLNAKKHLPHQPFRLFEQMCCCKIFQDLKVEFSAECLFCKGYEISGFHSTKRCKVWSSGFWCQGEDGSSKVL